MAISWSLLRLDACFVYTWVCLKFSTIKSVVFKARVTYQNFFSFEKNCGLGANDLGNSSQHILSLQLKVNLLFLQSNVHAL